MKFDREPVLGILFSLYLKRSGRATVGNAAISLGCSAAHLHKIAQKMKKKGLISSKRGIGGGYELVGDPTIIQIASAVKGFNFVSEEDKIKLNFGEFEQRAMIRLFLHITKTVTITVSELVDMQSKQERDLFKSVEEATQQ